MKNLNEHIDDIILKYSENNITMEETEELLSWVKEKMENKKYFKEQLAIIRNIRKPVADFDAHKSLSKLEEKKRPKKYLLFIKFTAIAASLILIILTGQIIINKTKSQNKTEYTTQNKTLKKILSDSTEVLLGTNSSISIPEKFTKKSREINLTGKAFFNVAKDKKRPFIITCKNITITVLGTSFEIETDTLKDIVNVYVSTGTVLVNAKESNLNEKVHKGYQITVSQKGIILNKSSIDNNNYLYWKTGIIEFDNTPMNDVAKTLTGIYNKKIIFEDNFTKAECITAKINYEPFSEVKRLLEIILNTKIEEKKDTLIFHKRIAIQ